MADSAFSGSDKTVPHTHDFYEFYLVRKGEIVQYRQNRKDVYPHRTIVFVPPTMMHCFACGSHFPEAVITNILFPTSLFENIMDFIGNKKLSRQMKKGFVLLKAPIILWERICRHVELLRPGREIDYKTKETIFKTVLIDLAAEVLDCRPDKQHDELVPWLKDACEKMRKIENLREGLCRFVALSGRTQEHLTRLLRKALGITPTEYINKQRLKIVEASLISTSRSIAHIACDAGFNNMAHFNALFKEAFGIPPREYRNRQRNEAVPRQ